MKLLQGKTALVTGASKGIGSIAPGYKRQFQVFIFKFCD